MIDWLNLLFNTTWILGAALALGAVGLAYFRVQAGRGIFRKILESPGCMLALNISGALFALGMGLIAKRWWEIGLWVVMTGVFAYKIYKSGVIK